LSTELRDYQRKLLDKLRGDLRLSPRALAVMPTGAGKTLVFTELVRGMIRKNARPVSVCVIVNRRTLFAQSVDKLEPCGRVIGSDGLYDWQQLTVAMAQTVISQPPRVLDLIVIDEAHRLSEGLLMWLQKTIDLQPRLRIVGFTATPFTMDGHIYGEGRFWPKPVMEVSLTELTRRGFLAVARLKGGDKSAVFDLKGVRVSGGEWKDEDVRRVTKDEARARAQIEDALKQLTGRGKVVWATSNIEHARLIHGLLNREGEVAALVVSDIDTAFRDEALSYFCQGPARHLVFVSIVSEGFDFPPIDAVVLLRPTRSPALYLQTVGRGLRPSPGKKDCLVLDYGRVVEHCGPLDRPFVREKGQRRGSVEEVFETRVVQCDGCAEFYFPPRGEWQPCPYCGEPNRPARRGRGSKLDTRSALGELYDEPGTAFFEKDWVWPNVRSCVLTYEDRQVRIVCDTSLGVFTHTLREPPASMPLKYRMGKFMAIKALLKRFGVEGTTSLEQMKRAPQAPLVPAKICICDEDHDMIREFGEFVPRETLGQTREPVAVGSYGQLDLL